MSGLVYALVLLLLVNSSTGRELGMETRESEVQTNGGTRTAEFLLEQLREQVYLYTQVMDLEVKEDKELYSTLIANFPVKMVSYLHAVKSESKQVDHSFLCDLVSAIHWLRFNAIKDRFGTAKMVAIDHNLFQTVAPWEVTLLSYTLSRHSHEFHVNVPSCDGKLTPLELAVRLQLITSVDLLLENGAVVCERSDGQTVCNSALLVAVTTQNLKMLQILLEAVEKMETAITVLLQRSQFDSNLLKGLNPLQASALICWSGLGCECYNLLISVLANSGKGNISKELSRLPIPNVLHKLIYTGTCSRGASLMFSHTGIGSTNSVCDGRIVDQGGWLTSKQDVFVGRIKQGCQLPHLSLGTLSASDFDSIFVKMR